MTRLLTDPPATCHDTVVLTYDQRLLRRKRLVTAGGEGFLVDLPAVTNLDDHWGFALVDGRNIRVVAAREDLVQVTGPDPLRYAWHIGNRHTPCQIEAHRLLIRIDHVLEAMLAGLGATLTRVTEPFTPEGGAYGHGRTMGHSHGAGDGGAGQMAPGDHGHGGHGDLALGNHGFGQAEDSNPASGPHGGASGPRAEGDAFGWHDHGDGRPHFHPPAPGAPDPLAQAITALIPATRKGRT